MHGRWPEIVFPCKFPVSSLICKSPQVFRKFRRENITISDAVTFPQTAASPRKKKLRPKLPIANVRGLSGPLGGEGEVGLGRHRPGHIAAHLPGGGEPLTAFKGF